MPSIGETAGKAAAFPPSAASHLREVGEDTVSPIALAVLPPWWGATPAPAPAPAGTLLARPPFDGTYYYPIAVEVLVTRELPNEVDYLTDESAILGPPDGVGLYAGREVDGVRFGNHADITLDFGMSFEAGWTIQVRHRNPNAPGVGVFDGRQTAYSTDGHVWYGVTAWTGDWGPTNVYTWTWDQPVPTDNYEVGAARFIRLGFGFWHGVGSGLDMVEGLIDSVRLSGTIASGSGFGAPIPDAQTLAPCDCPVGCNTHYQNWLNGAINTRTGNYYHSDQDISIPTLAGPLYFERSYNAQATDLYPSPLSPGWTHNYDMNLTFSDADTVVSKGCHGSLFRFTGNGSGPYAPAPGVWATLTRTQSAPYVYHLKGVDQSIYVFDSAGRLTEVRDPQDHRITLTYDGDERLIQVADAAPGSDRSLTLGYTDERVTSLTDHTGRSVHFGYTAGNLTTVTDTLDHVWTYVYSGTTPLLQEARDPEGRVVERTEYDGQGRAVRQWRDFPLGQTPPESQAVRIQYEGLYDTVVITDELGHVTLDWYTPRGTLVWQGSSAGASYRAYDANLNWTSTTDANGHATRYVFDGMAQPEQVTDALGNVTRMEYDGLNHLVSITNALTHTTRYVYEGNLLITTADALSGTVINTYDERGLLVRTVDHGVTTTYGYNGFGQRTVITDAAGLVTRYGYDDAGRLITATAANGLVTVNEYDDGDNLIRVTRNYTAAGGQNYLDVYNLVTEYEYDAAGRRAATTDTVGAVSRSEYDAGGRLARAAQNYLPGHPQNYQDTYNLVTEYGYDVAGRQAWVTDTLGHVTYTEYDELDRVKRTWQNYLPGYSQNWQDTYNLVTAYGYDAV
ncbi:MAG TPA: RHS repeat protein, partial [Chloroflexi bacterium]|nr:RHS repeat protein [Chloroflexota bacterium]